MSSGNAPVEPLDDTTSSVVTDTVGWFRGAGGAVWRMDLPLNPDHAAALAVGQLVRVNPDGSPYSGKENGKPTEPPSARAGKRDWVTWAVACGADPEDAAASTKQDLIEAYGSRHHADTSTGTGKSGNAPAEPDQPDGRG